MVQRALTMGQIAAGASVLNMGISLVGFGYTAVQLHQMKDQLQDLSHGVEALGRGMEKANEALIVVTRISESIASEQQRTARDVRRIAVAGVVEHLSEVDAILREYSAEGQLTDSAVRQLQTSLSYLRYRTANVPVDQFYALELELALQGWAAASALAAQIEADKGDPGGHHLSGEADRMRAVVSSWTEGLLRDEDPALATVYRFAWEGFDDRISPERLHRIASLAPSVASREAKRQSDRAAIAIEGRDAAPLGWIDEQVSLAAFLDGLAELFHQVDSRGQLLQCLQGSGVVQPVLDSEEPGLHILELPASPA